MAAPQKTLPTVGILSMGDMGSGVARLLVAKGFTVVTNCTGRSQDTVDRARSAGVGLLPDDVALVEASDVIFSIVPPRDARETAERVVAAASAGGPTGRPLYFADLNAVSPGTVRVLAELFAPLPHVRFVDGAIIGGPPHVQDGPASGAEEEWYVPRIPTSGPSRLPEAVSGALGPEARHISDEVGAASGLKMCFASLTKGYTALAVQSFATAARLGVLGELTGAVEGTIPAAAPRLRAGVTGMPPKAYRWVAEMEEIAETHRAAGGWAAEDMFRGAAGVYRVVAEETELGREKIGRRVRGTTVEDVAEAVAAGLEERERRGDREE